MEASSHASTIWLSTCVEKSTPLEIIVDFAPFLLAPLGIGLPQFFFFSLSLSLPLLDLTRLHVGPRIMARFQAFFSRFTFPFAQAIVGCRVKAWIRGTARQETILGHFFPLENFHSEWIALAGQKHDVYRGNATIGRIEFIPYRTFNVPAIKSHRYWQSDEVLRL